MERRLRPRVSLGVHRPGLLLTVPAGICAALGLVLGIANGIVDADARSYAAALRGVTGYHLALWHGFTLPLQSTGYVGL